MNNFQKTVIASSLLLVTASVVAADKVPTLGDVLKASGLSVSGYLDVSYTNFDVDAPNSVLLHAYDTEPDSFNFHSLTLNGGYQPAAGWGGFTKLQFGPDANVNASRGTGSADEFDVVEAYLQYATGTVMVKGGKFVTLAGAEVIDAPANSNFSRSLLFFNAIPFTHTGVRVSVAPSDALTFHVGVNNGWDIVKESASNSAGGEQADGKTVELGASATLAKWASLSAAYYSGDEPGTTGVGTRSLLDVVVNFPVTDALSFGLNYDMGEQEKGTATGNDAEWSGLAGYVNYKINDQWRIAGRLESFDDEDGFRTGTAQKYNEATVTLAYSPGQNSELRFEVRQDEADTNFFNGGTDDTQRLIGVQAIYKF